MSSDVVFCFPHFILVFAHNVSSTQGAAVDAASDMSQMFKGEVQSLEATRLEQGLICSNNAQSKNKMHVFQ